MKHLHTQTRNNKRKSKLRYRLE